jgi:hypothetical protein
MFQFTLAYILSIFQECDITGGDIKEVTQHKHRWNAKPCDEFYLANEQRSRDRIITFLPVHDSPPPFFQFGDRVLHILEIWSIDDLQQLSQKRVVVQLSFGEPFPSS